MEKYKFQKRLKEAVLTGRIKGYAFVYNVPYKVDTHQTKGLQGFTYRRIKL